MSMTKKQSIDYLKDLWNEVYNEDSDGYNYAEAIDMAIESLKKDIERHEMVIRASEHHLGIVRCKDCEYGEERIRDYRCWMLDEDWDIRFSPMHFCSYGRRREEAR